MISGNTLQNYLLIKTRSLKCKCLKNLQGWKINILNLSSLKLCTRARRRFSSKFAKAEKTVEMTSW